MVKEHLWVLWTDYFKPNHFEAHPQLHGLFNEATKLAGAAGTKGTNDVAVADKLLVKIDEIAEILSGMGQNYPNPSNGFTSILLENIDQNMNFDLIDITGKVVYSKQVAKGSNRLDLSTTNFAAGKYIYRLTNAKGNALTKTMVIK
jgi:hypothetical protein